MPLERIAAALFLQPIQNQLEQKVGANQANRLAPGQIIELTLDAAGTDGVMATTAQGLQLRLTGLDGFARQLISGETLRLRVLATTPRLELALLDAVTRSSSMPVGSPNDTSDVAGSAAMRFDQVAMLRQVVPARPDASAMASMWHATVLDHIEGHAVFLGQVIELLAPQRKLLTGSGATMGQETNAASPAPNAEYLLFAPSVYGFHRMALHVLDAEEDKPSSRRRPVRRCATIALQLESSLPGIGSIVVRMQLVCAGILIDMYCEESALTLIRRLRSDIFAALARADLLVVRFRVESGPIRPASRGANHDTDVSATLALPWVLFRAAAEIFSLLSSPSLPVRVSRSFR